MNGWYKTLSDAWHIPYYEKVGNILNASKCISFIDVHYSNIAGLQEKLQYNADWESLFHVSHDKKNLKTFFCCKLGLLN